MVASVVAAGTAKGVPAARLRYQRVLSNFIFLSTPIIHKYVLEFENSDSTDKSQSPPLPHDPVSGPSLKRTTYLFDVGPSNHPGFFFYIFIF